MADNMFAGLYPVEDTILHPPSSFEYTVTLDVPTAIIFCVFLALFFFILYYILSGLLQWLMEELPGQNDLEEGHLPGIVSSSSHYAAFFHVIMQSNLQVWRILETFTRDVELAREGNRFGVTEKSSLPIVKYGSHGVIKSCGACAICLEDFHLGESCHVFPGCNHIFHSECIGVWLKNKLTCPICRSSLYKHP